jgi:hypothetical protein
MLGEERACCPQPVSVSRAALWKLPVALQGLLVHGSANAQGKGVGSVALAGLRKTRCLVGSTCTKKTCLTNDVSPAETQAKRLHSC